MDNHLVIDLVERYLGTDYRPTGGGNIMLSCPFHGTKDGRPFSINIDVGLYHCFSCHVSGTFPQMLKLLGVPSALVEQETEGLSKLLAERSRARRFAKEHEWVRADPMAAQTPLSSLLLQEYNFLPLRLVEEGFDPRVLQDQQIGYDRQNNRITYPVFDIYGQLAGLVGGRQYDTQEPKYKVYRGRETDPITGRIFESDFGPWFHENYPNYKWQNHDHLWGYDRVYPTAFFNKEVQTLIIVEGFKARLWLLQMGYSNVVSVMGSKMSERQKQLILRPRVNVILFMDNDRAGHDGMRRDGKYLYQHQPEVWVARYPPGRWGCQPDHLRSQEELSLALANPIHYPQYEKEAHP